MRAKEFISEVLDSNIEYETERLDSGILKTRMKLSDNRDIVFRAGEWPAGNWDVEFYQIDPTTDKHTFHQTGAGEEFKVFSFIMKSLLQLIETFYPETIQFTSDKEDKSRSKLYMRMIQKYASKYGYELENVSSGGRDDFFTLVRKDNVTEAPLQSYDTLGDFDKPGPFRGPDKKLVPNPINQLKTQKFLENTPYDFRLFFSNISGTGKYSEYGPADDNKLREIFGPEIAQTIIDGSDDAITVVFVGNRGDAKVPMTPWIMAHRFGHAIQAGVRKNRQWSNWGEAERHFFTTINQIFEEYYGKQGTDPYSKTLKMDLTPEYNALFNAIGTQRSSRQGQIKRPYEFLYELFAQYLGTGEIKLNPLPKNLTYGRKAWGNPTRYLNIKNDYNDNDRRNASEMLANDMEYMFDDVLSNSVGKIFVM